MLETLGGFPTPVGVTTAPSTDRAYVVNKGNSTVSELWGGISTFVLGDVNGDGQVTAVDALCILRGVVRLPATPNCPLITASRNG